MLKRWRRVAMDADIMDHGGTTIIRITRGTKGDAMASAGAVRDGRRPAAGVLAEHKKTVAVVAVESDDLWDAAWGELK